MTVLIVCRGPIRQEALDVFGEMGMTKVGILLSRTEGEDSVNTITVAGRGTVLKATFGPGLFMKLEDQSVATKDVVGFGVAGYEVEFFYTSGAILMTVIVLHDAKRMLIDPVAQ